MLKLFPNVSVVLEQIHIFKTRVIAELTVPLSAGAFERSVGGDSG